jgi:Nif-specific regulatory protein
VTVPGVPGCVGTSREMHRLGRALGSVARSGVNVLLKGESGTGKEVIARALHLRSDRSRGPFVGQNCAALPETLFESELFGHRAGAFTGAAGEKKGLLAAASGGTFFLDEIGDMPLALQIKLLRTMQEGSVRRIGELQSRRVDIRFLAASHKDLAAEIAAGRFRLDLYYRLKVVCLDIPPLRHRPEDIAHLFAYFLQKAGRPIAKMKITERALASLQAWRWPGNVRELENEVKRFVALHPEATVVRLDQLSSEVRTARTGRVDASDLGTLRELGQANEILEKYLIRKAIAATEGRKAAAARCLGLSRQGLYKKIARYGMTDLIGSGES